MDAPQFIVSEDNEGQRLDNFILKQWQAAPRSVVYRLIRKGQIRINKKRARADSRLQINDCVRLPPSVYESVTSTSAATKTAAAKTAPPQPLALPILYEDAHLLAVDKPAGLAVHGGSGVAAGVIERLRATHASAEHYLELAHRLDKATSGVLLLAKKRSALRAVQSQWRAQAVQKIYYAHVFGKWQARAHKRINQPLRRITEASGNRQVVIDEAGKAAQTTTALMQQWRQTALISAEIATGRMHQIRAHLASVGLPVVGDKKYGDFQANHQLRQQLASVAADEIKNRMRKDALFLHAHRLRLQHPKTEEPLTITSPLPPAFYQLGEALDA